VIGTRENVLERVFSDFPNENKYLAILFILFQYVIFSLIFQDSMAISTYPGQMEYY